MAREGPVARASADRTGIKGREFRLIPPPSNRREDRSASDNPPPSRPSRSAEPDRPQASVSPSAALLILPIPATAVIVKSEPDPPALI
jgi:hypothetical protein